MAEPIADVKETGAPAKKLLKKSTMIKMLLGIAIVVALFAMVFYTTIAITKTIRTDGVNVEPSGISPERRRTFTLPPKVFPMDQFTSIITDATGRSFNLRLEISLTVDSERGDLEAVQKEIDERKAQLRDGIIEVLIGLDPQNFIGSPTQRNEGTSELRASIIRAVNARMKNQIDGVFIGEFVFQ